MKKVTNSFVTDRLLNALLDERGLVMTELDRRVDISWWVLRIALGLGPIIAGIDKYFNKLADWGMYLSPYATKVVPISTAAFMHVVGVVEIIAGLIVLSKWTRIGSYIVMLWLIAIAINLVTTKMFYDLAVRDIEIAVGAFVLSQLSVVHERYVQATEPAEVK